MEVEQHLPQEWKSIPAVAAHSEKISAYFDCSICLDFARDPVVTLCGHLYCWPCIYKWLQFQTSSVSSDEQQQQQRAQCPVCKAEISNATVVPLYGRGKTLSKDEPNDNATSPDMVVPPRPNVPARHPRTTSSSDHQFPDHSLHDSDTIYGEDPFPALSNLSSGTRAGGCHPGMFGEMVYARVFGNSESLYAYPNSYCLAGSSNARLRRQERIQHKSLSRVSLFLFCCLLLCLILF